MNISQLFLICSAFYGNLGGFQFGDCSELSCCEHYCMSFGEHMSAFLLGYVRSSEIAGLEGIHMFSFARYSQMIFLSNYTDLYACCSI